MKTDTFIRMIIGFCYLISIAILASSPFGVLNGPGIIAGGWALVLTIRGRIFRAGIIGITAGAASMIAQSLTAICTSCTLAAFAFALAGIISLLKIRDKHPLGVTALSAILCGSIVCYVNPGMALPGYRNESAFTTTVAANAGGNDCHTGISLMQSDQLQVRLYLSPVCPACESLLPAIISCDPDGQTWTPIIVPTGLADQGREWLFAHGYRGTVLTEQRSPTGAVPAMICGSRQYIGESEIKGSPFFMEILAAD